MYPTSTAIVSGGDVARDEFTAAGGLGKRTVFFPADMNHAIAPARAARNGFFTDFRARSAPHWLAPAGSSTC